jgi:hypothetical protein
VISTQHQRKVAQTHDALDLAGNESGCSRDLGQIAGPGITNTELLDVLDDDITLINDLMSQLGEASSHAGNANSGRAHVDATPPGAEVHRDTEYMDDHTLAIAGCSRPRGTH